MENYISTNPASGPNSKTKIEPFTKLVVLFATLGGLLFGYDTGVIAGALLFIKAELHLDAVSIGMITSSLLFGAAFGALVSGRISDKIGRRKIILLLATAFVIGEVGSSLSNNVPQMVFFRVILGIGVGGVAAVVPVYIAEMAPANRRGQLVTLQELMIVSGQLIAYISNFTLHQLFGGENSWRWMLVMATIPAVILWFGMLFMPDSPRWYALNGKLAKAKEVLLKIRSKEDAQWELLEIEETLSDESKQNGSFKDLATPWIFKVFLIGVIFVMFQQLTGVNAIMYYAPTILQTSGMSSDAALFATIANGVVSVVMTLVGIWLLGFIGRRTMALIGQMGCTFALFFIAVVGFFIPEFSSSGEVNLVRSYLVLIGMLLFLCAQQGALAPVMWLLVSEMFPMKVRGLSAGIAVFTLWCTNFSVALIFPSLLNVAGISGTYLIFACIATIGSLFMLRFLPETRGRSLEQIEHYLKEKYE